MLINYTIGFRSRMFVMISTCENHRDVQIVLYSKSEKSGSLSCHKAEKVESRAITPLQDIVN